LHHLFDLAIVVLPFLRPLRLLSLAVVIKVLQRAVGHTIRGRVIVYTACGAVLIVYAASLAILEIERQHPGSRITTFGDAVWWSITTVTTVAATCRPSPAWAASLRGVDVAGISLSVRHRDAGRIVQQRRRGHRRDDRAYRRTSGRDPATAKSVTDSADNNQPPRPLTNTRRGSARRGCR
jgi:hypothetical protein